eukprot:scaffold2224_cov261-Pinguiococcus_pyrenoidosus.AAC.43
MLQELELAEQLRALLGAHAGRPGIRHALRCVHPAVILCQAECLFPHAGGAIHAHGAVPVLGRNVVLLCLSQGTLHLVLLREEGVRLLEKMGPQLAHEADHRVVASRLLVHVDGEVGLLDSEVQLLGLPQVAGRFLPLRSIDVEHSDLCLGHAA